jgi:ligand-binding SRPBCC domain-containing protein
MAVYSLYFRQLIPSSADRSPTLDKVWSFFSNPANLPLITPPAMQFRVTSKPQGDRIYAGQLIEYRLRPLPLMYAYWLTEITHVSEGLYFVDEQRRGPYSLWHHQHHFKEIPGGVEMTDIVHYAIPFGWIGTVANRLLVARQLDEVFRYRRERVEEIFGKF